MANSDGKPVFGRRKPAVPPAPVATETPPATEAAQQLPPNKTAKSQDERTAGKFLSSGSKLASMLNVAYEKRDGRWNHEFLELIYNGFFYELHEVSVSPDGFKVYPVCLAEKGDPGAVSFAKAVGKAAKEGWGLAIFMPGNTEPRFVFTSGQISPYMATGKFMPLSTRPGGPKGEFTLSRDTPIITANPSPKILPQSVRNEIRAWLLENYNISKTAICVQMVDPRYADDAEGELMRSMVFHFEDIWLDSGTLGDIISKLYWFMTPDIATALIPGLNPELFHPL